MLVLVLVNFATLPVLADNNYGLNDTARAAKLTGFGSADDLPSKIGLVIFTVLSFIGVIFLVIVIYGGFLWMTAGGNTEQTRKASTMIKNGVIGIIIISLSYGLTLFIFNNILVDSGGGVSNNEVNNNVVGTGANCMNINIGGGKCRSSCGRDEINIGPVDCPTDQSCCAPTGP